MEHHRTAREIPSQPQLAFTSWRQAFKIGQKGRHGDSWLKSQHLGRTLRQEDHCEYEASLDYSMRPCLQNKGEKSKSIQPNKQKVWLPRLHPEMGERFVCAENWSTQVVRSLSLCPCNLRWNTRATLVFQAQRQSLFVNANGM